MFEAVLVKVCVLEMFEAVLVKVCVLEMFETVLVTFYVCMQCTCMYLLLVLHN